MRHSIYSRLGLVPLSFNGKALYMINALLTNDKAAEGVSGNPFPTPPRGCHAVTGGCHAVTRDCHTVTRNCHTVTGGCHTVTGGCHAVTRSCHAVTGGWI